MQGPARRFRRLDGLGTPCWSMRVLSPVLAFFVLAMVLALSGCTQGGTSWKPSGCATGDGPSGNAPLAAFLIGSDAVVAQRVSTAFGDPISGPDPDASGSAYKSARGMWRVEGEPTFVSFFGTGDAWVDEDLMDGALATLGMDVDELHREEGGGSVDYWQPFEGARVARAGFSSLPDGVSVGEGYGTFTSVEVGDLRDLADARASVPQSDAIAIAQTYVACADDWKGLDLRYQHASVDVASDSIVRTVAFAYDTPNQHCTTSYVTVHVDAVTGSVLGDEPSLCM